MKHCKEVGFLPSQGSQVSIKYSLHLCLPKVEKSFMRNFIVSSETCFGRGRAGGGGVVVSV